KESHLWFRDRVVTMLDDHDQVRKGDDKARFCARDDGGALVLAALALHLFTARAVAVLVVPDAAEVRLTGSLLPLKLGGRYLLRPGSYLLSMTAAGYEPLSQSITVGDEPRQDFRFELAKLPGRVFLEGAPRVPLRFAVDGRELAPEADGSYLVPAGRRSLEVSAERYLPWATTIDVEGADVRQSVTVQLLPNWADVTLTSEPAGASITVGNDVLGSTPATVPIVAGATEVELRKDGYKPWRQRLQVTAGQALELPLVRLQETDGLLSVNSTPPGAAVSVDGRYRGVTPIELDIASGRAHEVIVASPGYETVTRQVQVERRGNAALRLELAERVGLVRLVSDPPDAEVWVNGERRGTTDTELPLRAVAQRIELRKAGFVPFATEVTPRPGLTQLVEARLQTPAQAALATLPPTVTTSQGLVLHLVGPGEFEMGAPRREQGRRPNESQRKVRLTRHFYIATREITNREFREFRPGHASGAEKYRELAGAGHPAVMLSWDDAVGFCNWLSDREGLPAAYRRQDGALRLVEPFTTGYRLPTEAEWAWAGRYNGGSGGGRYPWGEQMPPAAASGNFADQSARAILPNALSSYDDGYAVTAPAGSFAASPLGLFDIGGNAAEWMHDFYTVYPGVSAPVAVDPMGPANGQYHVIRGSSWRSASISELRLAYRDFGDAGRLDVGFRIARFAN
ncbi:MAG: PEGA domain-containing protein, partial [Gammaproteobacteria bacterium]|nr:PEGA domain-containing protein [Gammaproteobacteria bacterium]